MCNSEDIGDDLLNRKLVLIVFSSLLMFLMIILLIKFPNDISNGDKLFYSLGLKPWSNGTSGFNYVGMLILLLLIVSMTSLSKAYNYKYSGRILIISIIILSVLPSIIVEQYQIHIAEGIYSLEYNHKNSNVNFLTNEENKVQGECNLEFTNHSKEQITFYVSLRDDNRGDSINSFLYQVNVINNYKLTINPKETIVFNIPFSSDVSNSTFIITNGTQSWGLKITISDGINKRDL